MNFFEKITTNFKFKVKHLVQVYVFNRFPSHKIPHFKIGAPHIKNILNYYSEYKFFNIQIVTLIFLCK